MTDGAVTFRGGGAYGDYDGIELLGDLYLSKITKPRPARGFCVFFAAGL